MPAPGFAAGRAVRFCDRVGFLRKNVIFAIEKPPRACYNKDTVKARRPSVRREGAHGEPKRAAKASAAKMRTASQSAPPKSAPQKMFPARAGFAAAAGSFPCGRPAPDAAAGKSEEKEFV